MKKILALFLSILLAFSVCAVSVSAADTSDLRIAVASDLHFNFPREEIAGPEIGSIDDPLFWYANRRAAMEDESGFIIDAFLRQCAESDYDYVLIAGDLADNGRSRREEHEAVAAKLAAFEQATGKQVFVIDGNHDLGNGSATEMQDFKEIYADFGYDRALTVSEDDCSYTADLGSKYRLIALDSCNYNKSTEDGMTAKKIAFVHREAKNAKKDGRYPIVMMHHNLLDHMPMQRIVSRNFIVRFHRSTAELFADWGIRVVLSGHEHCSDAAVYTSALGNRIYDFANTSLTMFPLSFREMTFTDETVQYDDVPVQKIDTDALRRTVRGYSDAQIDAMNADLAAYAKGFLKKGVEYRLWLSLTLEKMGVKESDFYYDAVYAVFSRLNELLAMPLYGEGSVQELGKAYNINIPDSAYENGWDVATELVAWHYAGSEPFGLDSTEVTLLLRTVNLILHDDLARFNDAILLKGANALLRKNGEDGIAQSLTKLGCKVFGPVTAGEFFLLALFSPLLYEFGFDGDGVDDNHGTIPGYGVRANAQNARDGVLSFFRLLLVRFENLLLIVRRVFRLA
ncbi:MAG: metallophosphoesterase [Clostridia bacterium]|nr:metallophosphoesterase [Clostridia bacterium]